MTGIKHTILTSITLFILLSCSTGTIIEGKIETVNIDIPDDLYIDIVLFNPENTKTVKVSTLLQKDGSFKVNTKNQEFYVVHIDVPSSDYTISDSWLLQEPVQLFSGDSIYLENLYISTMFTLNMEMSISNVKSFGELDFSWNNIPYADYYAVYINDDRQEGNLVLLYVTKEPSFSNVSSTKTISFDQKMNAREVSQNAPFFRIKKEVDNGMHKMHVAAIKEIKDGFETIIARSETISFTILHDEDETL